MITTALASLALIVAPAEPPIEPTLTRISELRETVLIEPEQDFSFDHPGLTLTFDMNLAPGEQFLAFDQERAKVAATDSAGVDLTTIEENFFGRREHFEAVGVWGEDGLVQSSFTIKLAKPARSAETFSIDATIPATVFAGAETHDVSISSRQSELTGAFGRGATIQMSESNGATHITIKPGTLKETIQDIKLILPGGETVESMSTMWNDDSARYSFETAAPAHATARIIVRTDLRTVPMRVYIEKMPLP